MSSRARSPLANPRTLTPPSHLGSLLLLAIALSLAGCDGVTEPAPLGPESVARATADVGGVTYASYLLPQGEITGMRHTYLQIEEDGDIFGSVYTDGATYPKAARWTTDADGSISGPVLLGDLPAPFADAEQTVRISDNAGVVLGHARDPATRHYTGWIWQDGAMTQLLPIPDDSWPLVAPFSINASGIAVGQVRHLTDDGGQDYGAVWLPPYDGDPIFLPTADGYGLNSARHITDHNVVYGWVRGGGLPDALVRWTIDEQGNVLSGPTFLANGENILPGSVSSDHDVGCLYTYGSPNQACVYRLEAETRIDLGLLEGYATSWARDVSPRAADGSVQVIGWARNSYPDDRAALWRVDGNDQVSGPYALPLPDPYPNNAPSNRFEANRGHSLNSLGWAVGWSLRGDGAEFATLWLPSSTDGGTDDSGDKGGSDCTPRGNGNNCK